MKMKDKYRSGDILRTPVRGQNPLYVLIEYTPSQRINRTYGIIDLILKLKNPIIDQSRFIMPIRAQKVVEPRILENKRLYRKCDRLPSFKEPGHEYGYTVFKLQQRGSEEVMHCNIHPLFLKYLRVMQ